MYLYELALELGIRSPDLVERAAALGMADVGPGSSLTAAQVAAIRSGVPIAAASTVAPPLAPPPPPPGPLAGPAPVDRPPFAADPAFGVDPAVAASPSFAVPPAGPPPPPAGGPNDGADHDAGQARRTQLVAVAVLAPLLIALFAFMVVNSGPDERREDAIRAQAEADDEPSGPAVAGGLDGERDDTGEVAPEEAPEATFDTTGRRVEDPFLPGAPEPGEPTDPCGVDLRQGVASPRVDDCPSTGPSDDELSREPVDTEAFCASMQSLVAFELELAGAALRGSSLRDVVLRSRDRWVYDVAAAFASAPPDLEDDLETYREQYSAILLPVDETTSNDEILRAMAATGGRGLGEAATNLNERLVAECGIGGR